MASLPGRNVINFPTILAFLWILLMFVPQVTPQACQNSQRPGSFDCGYPNIANADCLLWPQCCFLQRNDNLNNCWFPPGAPCRAIANGPNEGCTDINGNINAESNFGLRRQRCLAVANDSEPCCFINRLCLKTASTSGVTGCQVQQDSRTDCAYSGVSTADCLDNDGCCYDNDIEGAIWCFYRSGSICAVDENSRVNCLDAGNAAITDHTICQSRDCCWMPNADSSGGSICHYPINICAIERGSRVSVPGQSEVSCVDACNCWDPNSNQCFYPTGNTQGNPSSVYPDNTNNFCSVPTNEKVECGSGITTQDECINTNVPPAPGFPCCWYQDDGTRGYNCYRPFDRCLHTVGSLRLPCVGMSSSIPTLQVCSQLGCCWDASVVPVPMRCYARRALDVCSVATRTECGYPGISESNCLLNTQCCFNSTQADTIHCYNQRNSPCSIQDERIQCADASTDPTSRTECLRRICCYHMVAANGDAECSFRRNDVCAVPPNDRSECRFGSGLNEAQCNTVGCCYFPGNTPAGVADCYNPIGVCDVDPNDRTQCGSPSISQYDCAGSGCCWNPNPTTRINCYLPTGLSPSRLCPVRLNDRTECGTGVPDEVACSNMNCCWFPSEPGTPSCFSSEERCVIDEDDRQACSGSNQQQCDSRSCCFFPTNEVSVPDCYLGMDQISSTTTTTTTIAPPPVTTVTPTTPTTSTVTTVTPTTPTTSTEDSTTNPTTADPFPTTVVDELTVGTLLSQSAPVGEAIGVLCELDPPAAGVMQLFQTDDEDDPPIPVAGSQLSVNGAAVAYPFTSFVGEIDPAANAAFQCCFSASGETICSQLRRLTGLNFDQRVPVDINEGDTESITYSLDLAPALACRNVPGFNFNAPLSKVIVQFKKPFIDITRTCRRGSVDIPSVVLLHGDEDCRTVIYRPVPPFPGQNPVRSHLEIVSVENNIVTGDTQLRFPIWITLVDSDGTECKVNGGYLTVNVNDRTIFNSACSVRKGTLWRTFSGKYIFSGLVGLFKMHQSSHLSSFVLYIKTKDYRESPDDDIVTAPCAAICQAGDDIIEINACGNTAVPGGYAPAVVRSTITGSLTYGFKFFSDGNRAFYRCYYPDGGYANIYTAPFSVWYFPSSSDYNAKGICGELQEEITIISITGQVANNLINAARLSGLYYPLSTDQLQLVNHYITKRDFCYCDYYSALCCSATPYIVCVGEDEYQWDSDKLDRLPDVDLSACEDYGDKDERPTNGYDRPVSGSGPFCEREIDNVVDACDNLNSAGFPSGAETSVAITACKNVISLSGSLLTGLCIVGGLAKQCLSVVAQLDSSPPTVVPIVLCPGRCSNSGTCLWPGFCDCDPGKFGPTCGSDTQDGAVLTGIVSGNTCNPAEESCNMITISGTFNPDLDYYCIINKIKISEIGSTTVGNPVELPAGVISTTQIKCPVQSYSAYISVRDSNGRESNSLLYLVFDPRCWRCTFEPLRCTRGRDGCLINYECIGRGTEFGGYYEFDSGRSRFEESAYQGIKCYFCDPQRDPNDWSVRKDKRCEDRKRPDDDDDDPPRWKFIVLVAASVALVIAIVIIIVCLVFRCCHCCSHGYHNYNDDASSSNESSTYGKVLNTRSGAGTLGVYATLSRPYWKN